MSILDENKEKFREGMATNNSIPESACGAKALATARLIALNQEK